MTREVTEAIEYIKTYRKLDENLYNTAPKGSVSFYATEKCLHYWDMAIKALEIELLTDTEQRIFLKAINREREVCQKIDDEYSDDDSKVSLVKVCNSIERKVKKIWE